VSALDAKIDDLYRAALNDFTAARNALAKSLSGDEAKRVRALAKPTVVPWAVNQVYWHARATYDRVMKSGERVRKAQIAALEGRSADVRAASEAHRHAIGEAVAEAERLAKSAGAKPGADALARTFESLSLATGREEAPGRLTEALQPAGFEALAGITPQPQSAGPVSVRVPAAGARLTRARGERDHADRDRGPRRDRGKGRSGASTGRRGGEPGGGAPTSGRARESECGSGACRIRREGGPRRLGARARRAARRETQGHGVEV
jgi:hypothetical protein